MAGAMMAKRTTRPSRRLRKSDGSSNGDGCHKKRNEWQRQVQLTANDLWKGEMVEGIVAMVPSILELLRYRAKSSPSWTKVDEGLLHRQRSRKGMAGSQILSIPPHLNGLRVRHP